MLNVLYQDEYLVAIDKPSGLLVHRSPIDKHETRFAIQETRNQIGQRVYPVHRLDKPTSGILLFALDSETARLVSEQFSQHTIEKTYHAVVRGYTPEQGHIDYALKEQLDDLADKHKQADREPQSAVTDYARINTTELPFAVDRYPSARYSLVELKPKTGRKHQLRRHMKHISHPIIGDTTHGNGAHNRFFREQFDCHRLLLHAQKLELKHPYTHEQLTIQAEYSDHFAHILKQAQLIE